MRRVRLGATGIETSCIGFGCASLGSRVSAEEGLRALEAAFERGVTWIDLAPIYGAGAAETIAARFLAPRREALQVCTKVGLALPAAGGALGGGLRGAVMPLARRAVAAVPGLRGALRRRGIGGARSLPLTPELVRDSLEASLRRLGTDRVELYALHDPDPEDLAREPVLRALEDAVAAGKARALAVAGDAAAAARAAALVAAQRAPFAVVQLPLPEPGPGGAVPEGRVALERAAAAGLGWIVHSIFGIDGAFARLGRRLAEDQAVRRAALAHTGTEDAAAALGRLLLERAFALNPDGVVLASMFSERSREADLAVAEAEVCPAETLRLIDRLAA